MIICVMLIICFILLKMIRVNMIINIVFDMVVLILKVVFKFIVILFVCMFGNKSLVVRIVVVMNIKVYYFIFRFFLM